MFVSWELIVKSITHILFALEVGREMQSTIFHLGKVDL